MSWAAAVVAAEPQTSEPLQRAEFRAAVELVEQAASALAMPPPVSSLAEAEAEQGLAIPVRAAMVASA